MKKTHPLFGKNHADITEEDLENLSDEQYEDYLRWRIFTNLDYLVKEGFVKTSVNDKGEVLYRQVSDF
jgi:Fe2+ or Zn2+ uptake regulation protein